MSPVAFTDAVDQIRNGLDIVDIVSRHVVLKRSGRNHTGLCPFHKDKKPSFSVNKQKNIYKCFSCGEGGDAFSFLMKMESKTFGEVIFDLADEQGIEIERKGHNAEAAAEKKALKQQLLEVNQEASRWFQSQLNTPLGTDAKSYLERRGVTVETMERFKLGFVPDGWDNLTNHLLRQLPDVQKAPSLLETSGLASPRKDGNGFYDRFRKRLIVPIHDDQGKVVAFGGRAMTDEDQPKYLNSPETELYHKSNVLYGLFQARETIRETQSAIVMEGYFDVTSAHQGGVTQAVGSCGTALTEQHLKLLSRYGAETVYLAFDADRAGISAALKAIEIIEPYLTTSDLKIKILSIPDGKDPDDFIRNNGGAAFQALVDKAVDYLRFQLNNAVSGLDLNNPDDRVVGAVRVAPLLLKAVHPVHRQELIQQYAGRLNISEEALHLEVKRLFPKRRQENKGWQKNKWNSKQNIKNRNKSAINYSASSLNNRTTHSSQRTGQLVDQFSPAALDHLSSLRSKLSQSPLVKAEEDLLALMLCNDASLQLVLPIVQTLSLKDNNHQTLIQWLQSVESLTPQSLTLQSLTNALEHYLDNLIQQTPDHGQVMRKVVTHLRYHAEGKNTLFQLDAKSPAEQHRLISSLAQSYTQVIQVETQQEQLKSMNMINQDSSPESDKEQPSGDLAELELQYQLREQLASRAQKR